ncbi:SH3 domain-binding protein 5-like isoform X1 [Branchiostoma floridae]|uniref:SH3 domain-binding protein 5-like isoform X1 n=1 Tax=Branchiostoma floridae TaxID=7739 RepID=A0A9J7LWF5_BRAFL|nr:SH3 domain-binding protein 5-like isoform X1 [Branchiostoma floridae]
MNRSRTSVQDRSLSTTQGLKMSGLASVETFCGDGNIYRIRKEELERLNAASNEINKLEAELDEARALFRQTLTESTQKLNLLSKKMGKSVQKARPYYDAKKMAKQAQIEAQKAAVEYQRANGIHRAARETISLAEQRLFSDADEKRQFDSAWQEMLNHATMKVMEAEQMRSKSEHDHQQKAEAYTTANQKLQQLEKSLKKVIVKTKPYFDVKTSFELQLLQQKQNVEDLQKAVSASKVKYREALKNLESISDEIHRNRQLLKEPRSAGVGAEADRDDLPEINLDDVDSCSQYSDLDDGHSLDTDSTTDDASMIAQTDNTSLSRRDRGGSFTSHSSVGEGYSSSSQDVTEGGCTTVATASCTAESVQAVEGGSNTEGTAAAVPKQAVEQGPTAKVTAVDRNNTEDGATFEGMAALRKEEEKDSSSENSHTTSQNDAISKIEADKTDKEDTDVLAQQDAVDDVEKALKDVVDEDVVDEGKEDVSHCSVEPTPSITVPGKVLAEENVEQQQGVPTEVVEAESDSFLSSHNEGERKNVQNVAEECDMNVPDEVKVSECREEVTEKQVEQVDINLESSENSAQENQDPTVITDMAEKETVETREESQTAGLVTGRNDDSTNREESTEASSSDSTETNVTDLTVLSTNVEERPPETRQTDESSSADNIERGDHQVENRQGVDIEGQMSEVMAEQKQTMEQSSEIQGQGDSLEKDEKQNLSSPTKSVDEMTAEEIDELEDTYL